MKEETYLQFVTATQFLGDVMIPKTSRKIILNYLSKVNISDVPYFAYGIAAYVLFIASVVLNIMFLNTLIFSNAHFLAKIMLSFIFVPGIFLGLYYLTKLGYVIYLNSIIFRKIRKMEDHFPDFLTLLSLNLKSGQILGSAIENSIEPEFGPLAVEMRNVTRKIHLGQDVGDALNDFSKKYDSRSIKETFNLINISWKKGTNTPKLVDRIIENISEARYLKNKIIAGVTNYKIFLSVLALFITPAMFSLTFYMIDLIRKISGQLKDVSASTTLPVIINTVRINDSQFIFFSIIVTMLISVCIAIIISIVKAGTAKGSLWQIFFYAGGSLISYQIFMIIFGRFFALFVI